MTAFRWWRWRDGFPGHARLGLNSVLLLYTRSSCGCALSVEAEAECAHEAHGADGEPSARAAPLPDITCTGTRLRKVRVSAQLATCKTCPARRHDVSPRERLEVALRLPRVLVRGCRTGRSRRRFIERPGQATSRLIRLHLEVHPEYSPTRGTMRQRSHLRRRLPRLALLVLGSLHHLSLDHVVPRITLRPSARHNDVPFVVGHCHTRNSLGGRGTKQPKIVHTNTISRGPRMLRPRSGELKKMKRQTPRAAAMADAAVAGAWGEAGAN